MELNSHLNILQAAASAIRRGSGREGDGRLAQEEGLRIVDAHRGRVVGSKRKVYVELVSSSLTLFAAGQSPGFSPNTGCLH